MTSKELNSAMHRLNIGDTVRITLEYRVRSRSSPITVGTHDGNNLHVLYLEDILPLIISIVHPRE